MTEIAVEKISKSNVWTYGEGKPKGSITKRLKNFGYCLNYLERKGRRSITSPNIKSEHKKTKQKNIARKKKKKERGS